MCSQRTIYSVLAHVLDVSNKYNDWKRDLHTAANTTIWNAQMMPTNESRGCNAKECGTTIGMAATTEDRERERERRAYDDHRQRLATTRKNNIDTQLATTAHTCLTCLRRRAAESLCAIYTTYACLCSCVSKASGRYPEHIGTGK